MGDSESRNSNSNGQTNGWQEYKLLVLDKLDALIESGKSFDKELRALAGKVEDLSRDLSVAKTKIGGLSTIISIVVSFIMSIVLVGLKRG